MINELEKTFFDMFGIKAHYKYLLIDKTSRCHNEKLFDKTNFIDFVKSGKDYLLLKVIKYHPQITDRMLLELICILTKFYGELVLEQCLDIKDLKEQVLNIFMRTSYKDDFKYQVHILFEEEKWIENKKND